MPKRLGLAAIGMSCCSAVLDISGLCLGSCAFQVWVPALVALHPRQNAPNGVFAGRRFFLALFVPARNWG